MIPQIDALLRTCRELQQEAVAEARRSSDPVRREIGREIAAGRLTPREAITSAAYRDFFQRRFAAVAAYQAASEDDRAAMAAADEQPAEPELPTARPVTRTGDDDEFDDHSFVRG